MTTCSGGNCQCDNFREELNGPHMVLNGNCINCRHPVNAHPRRNGAGILDTFAKFEGRLETITHRLDELSLARHQQQYAPPRYIQSGTLFATEVSSLTNPTGLRTSAPSSPPQSFHSDSPPHVRFSEESKSRDGMIRNSITDSAGFFSAQSSLVETPSVANASIETNTNSTIVPSVDSAAADTNTTVVEDFDEASSSSSNEATA